ncbi:MAG: hypothetical protein WA061_06295 [Microgenomates group bacterium]
MKVYFAASVRGFSFYSQEYKAIEDGLRGVKCNLTTASYEKEEVKRFYDNLENGGLKAQNEYFNNTIETIKNSDVNIFECSSPSLGIGFQVERSLEYNKPTIILYLKGHVPHFFAGTDNEKMLLKEYTVSTAKEVVESSIEEANHIADKRFNFFISPSLLTYLENTSKKMGITKSTFIRSLIVEHMRKSKKR